MNRLIAYVAAALVFMSGCTPASLAQGIENAVDAAAPVAVVAPRVDAAPKVDTAPKEAARSVTKQAAGEAAKDVAEPAPKGSAQEVAETEQEPPRLWMDVSMGAELLDWYNETAHAVDIARVDHVSMIDLLENVEVGRRLVVFKNVADAQALLPRLADKMDIVGYNLEHGPTNRPDEQADPVGSVQRMRALADEYGLELALGPDHAFALNDGVAMAPYVDIFVLQVQRVQTEPDVVRDFVLPLTAKLRSVNPDLEVSVQVRTEGDPVALADLVTSMAENLDGVSILTNGESTEIAQDLVAELRPPAPEMPGPSPRPSPSPTRSDSQVIALPTVTPAPRRTQTATAAPAVTAVPANEVRDGSHADGWPFAVGLAALGVLIAGLVTTMGIYVVQNIRYR